MEKSNEIEEICVKNKLDVITIEKFGMGSEKQGIVETSNESLGEYHDEEIPFLNLIFPDFRLSKTHKIFCKRFTKEAFTADTNIHVLDKASDILSNLCGIIIDEVEISYGYQLCRTKVYELHGYESFEEAIREKSSDFYHLFSDYLTTAEQQNLIDTQEEVSEKEKLIFILKHYNYKEYEDSELNISYHEQVLDLKKEMPFHFEPMKSDSEITKSIKNSLYYTSGLFLMKLVHVYGYDNTPSSSSAETRLLWHGTPLENVASILEYGLEIGDGYGSLGRALYFSESVKTPIHFCMPSKCYCERLLLLYEVDIGKPYLVNGNASAHGGLSRLDEAPGGCDSVHQRTLPLNMNNFHCHTDEYGAKFFDGTLRNTMLQTKSKTIEYERTEEGRLEYSQLAVYDKNRVKLRYLVHVRFNEK